MAEVAAFHIARIEYRIRAAGYPLRLTLDAAYQPFLGAVHSPGWVHPIEVEARVGELSIEPGWQQLFEAGDVWRLFASGNRRIIVRYAGTRSEPLCAAVMDEEVRSVDVLCSQRLVGATVEGPCLENPIHYPLDQLLLIRALGPRGVLVHSAAASSGRRGVLLAGVSGAGKTTISRLLHAHGPIR